MYNEGYFDFHSMILGKAHVIGRFGKFNQSGFLLLRHGFDIIQIGKLLTLLHRWWLYDPVLLGWNFNPFSQDRSPSTITWGNQFSSRPGGTSFHLVFVYKNPQTPIDLQMFKTWWNSIDTFVCFFLTDWCRMRRKNITEITTIYWNVHLWIFFKLMC